MFPLRDNIPARTTPVLNWVLIAVTAAVFVAQLAQGPDEPALAERLGMIPARLTSPGEPVLLPELQMRTDWRGPRVVESVRPAAPAAVPPLLTLVTCIFLHGGWLHFLGNMWFLWVFGDNVEDRLGHLRFLLFYLGAGTAASLAHLLANPASPIPTVGASGAIAGVMGAYMFLYPRAMVVAAVPIFFFIHMVVLPAPVFLGIWFLIQLVQGVASVTDTVTTGVAWWAHIGGFAIGAAVVWLLRGIGGVRAGVQARRPGMDHARSWRRQRRWGGM